MSNPANIDDTEEAILNPDALPEYMRNSRRFRISYHEPGTGFSNFESTLYLNKDDPNIFERVRLICDILEDSYGIKYKVIEIGGVKGRDYRTEDGKASNE